ncbi:MAG: Epimerase family protein [Verrucomicrobia subdivision 3 bacterium]|nr:Epimerase family protein [Limisphaerales bacterium]MCS1415405.1 Epimerase family protein [Limisphaerales bacterium]
MKVLISGTSGLLGRRLTDHFASQQADAIPIVRVLSDKASQSGAAWNPQSGWFDLEAMEGSDVFIHLAGENIGAGRWTAARKERIRMSRVKKTTQLTTALAQLQSPPKHFLCASGTGFYGDSGSQPRPEDALAGNGFLASVCVDWEKAALQATVAGIHTHLLRFGMILDPAGGALRKMLLPFRLGIGGRIGSGKQFFPWIAAPEVPHIIDFLLQQPSTVSGPINVVAPQAITNTEFTQILARHLRRPAFFPVPGLVVRTIFGEMGQEMLLSGCRAVPQALANRAYPFRYPTLDACLQAILPRH